MALRLKTTTIISSVGGFILTMTLIAVVVSLIVIEQKKGVPKLDKPEPSKPELKIAPEKNTTVAMYHELEIIKKRENSTWCKTSTGKIIQLLFPVEYNTGSIVDVEFHHDTIKVIKLR